MHTTFAETIRQQTEEFHRTLLGTGAPERSTILQAAYALAKIGTASDITWLEEQLEDRQIRLFGRWPWSPKTILLRDVARRAVVEAHDH